MVCRVESFIHEQATDEGSSDSGKELQHFSYLDRRNRGADGTEYTAFSARRHQSGRGAELDEGIDNTAPGRAKTHWSGR